jgi:galactose oxidase-like protein
MTNPVASKRPPSAMGRFVLCLLCIPLAARAQPGNGVWQMLSGPIDPPQAAGHQLIHDPLRHRMVMIIGSDVHEMWTLSLAGQPTWRRVPIEGTEFPALRNEASAVYDSLRDRIVMYGGRAFSSIAALGDVWSLSLGEHPAWSQIVPEGDAPAPRGDHVAVFDLRRDRMIVFGGSEQPGYEGEQYFSDAWELDFSPSPRWAPIVTQQWSKPLPRHGATAVYDPWNDRMLVYGGFGRWIDFGGNEHYSTWDDTWALLLSGMPAWRQIGTIGLPPGRSEAVAIVDPVGRQMIMSGGGVYDDTWALSLDPRTLPTWTPVPTTGEHPVAADHAAIYAPERGTMIQFGGERVGNECTELNLATRVWSEIDSDVRGPFPSRRMEPTLLRDDGITDRLLLFGGQRAGCQHDLWAFDLAGSSGWERIPTNGVAPACGAPAFVYDRARHRLLALAGGYISNRGDKIDQAWALDLSPPGTWTRLVTSGPLPPGRARFSLIDDPVRDRVLLFGGIHWVSYGDNFGEDHDDVWALSLKDLRWEQLHPVNSPGARQQQWAGYDVLRDRMLVVGGANAIFIDSWPRYDCWALPLGEDSLRWRRLGPDVPVRQPAVLDPRRDRLVVWSGGLQSGTQAWALSLTDTSAWQPIVLGGDPPAPRAYYGLTFDERNDQMLILGGFDGSLKGDLQALRFSDDVGVQLQSGPGGRVLPARSHATIEAAILGSAAFSVDSILPASVTLAGAHAAADRTGAIRADRRDVDGDGHPDLVLWFPIDSLRLAPEESVLPLRGRTPNFEIRGLAPVRIVPGSGLRASGNERAGRLAVAALLPDGSGLAIRYTIPTPAPARLELFDVAGRRMLQQELRGDEPGDHVLRIAPGALPPGVYLVRLRQGARVAIARAVTIN